MRSRAGSAVDPYAVLGLRPGASSDEVRAAWRRFARAHHPDGGGNAARFRQGSEAYRLLMGGRVPPSASSSARVVFYRRPRGLEVPVAWCRSRWLARRRPKRVV